MKTYKRAQSTLNYEYGMLKKHPEFLINKTKDNETYLCTHKDCPTYIIDVYFGKLGNVIGITTYKENGDLIENLELRTA